MAYPALKQDWKRSVKLPARRHGAVVAYAGAVHNRRLRTEGDVRPTFTPYSDEYLAMSAESRHAVNEKPFLGLWIDGGRFRHRYIDGITVG